MGKNHQDIDAEWGELLNRAMLSLDEAGMDQFNKRKAVAAKKLNRQGLQSPPVDLAKVKEMLLLYHGGKTHSTAVKETGIAQDDVLTAYDLWPESRTVLEYIRERRHQKLELENIELIEKAQERLKDALDDVDGSTKVNPKILELSLARLDRKRFGDGGGIGNGNGSGSSQLTYEITNVQINLPGGNMDGVFPKGGVIDVDEVVKALDGKGA